MLEIKQKIEQVLQCPECRDILISEIESQQLVCTGCGQVVKSFQGKPVFIEIPENISVTEFRQRGEGKGTPWRQANWRFLESRIDQLPGDALVLDVGSGRGDFSEIIALRRSLALDIYPYPEVDIVCDLTQVNPFKENCFDAIVLMNVLEHVFDSKVFLKELAKLLKPGGQLLVAVPFLLKVHQAPFDFVRYTQFAFERLGKASGLNVELLEGYYDPMFLVEQGSNNLKHTVFPGLPRLKNYLARGLFAVGSLFTAGVAALVGSGFTKAPQDEASPAPIGYHVVYRKEKNVEQ
jgi:SAM-dependent methyltransferase